MTALAETRPVRQSCEMRAAWGVPGVAAYALCAGALAAAGDTRSAVVLLCAAAVTFPVGVAALAGVYAVYGVLVAASRLTGAEVMVGNGWGPHWFVLADEVLVAALFAAAAVGNSWVWAALGRRLGARRGGPTAPPPL